MIKKYLLLIITISIFGLSPGNCQTFGSFNPKSQKQNKDLNQKPRGSRGGAKQIDVNAVADNGYVPGATHNVYFTFEIANTDFEFADSVSMTFPAGVTLNSVSNDEFFGPSFVNPAGPDGDPEVFNGIDGQMVSWGDNDNEYGGITSQGNIYQFSVNASFDVGISGDQIIEVHVSGDEYGDTPGDQDFQITISEDTDPVAQVQVIHNSADLGAAEVDVRLNGTIPDPSLDNLAFRNATSFLDLPAAQEIEITVNDPGSTDDSNPLFTQALYLDPGVSYIAIASGIVSGSGYDPLTTFTLEVFPLAQQTSSEVGFTDVLIFHGSTDAPEVNVNEPIIGAPLVTNLEYSEFNGYISLPTDNYVLEVATTNSETVGTYAAPLLDLGLEDAAITVLASGFLNPENNSNADGFGLWVALPDGGALVELTPESYAQVQVIHNCADLAAEFVDIRINGDLHPFFDNFQFRTASPFVALPSDNSLVITVNDSSSTDDSNPLYTIDLTGALEVNEKYILLAEGIVSDIGYSPGLETVPFQLRVIENAREGALAAGNTDVLVLHSSTDAPPVTINELTVPVDDLVENISYGESQGYIELATDNYGLQVINENNGTEVGNYSAALAESGLQNAAVSVLASGFVSPFDNQDGAEFGLWAALPSGGNLIELGVFSVNDTPCNALSIDANGETVQGGNVGATIDEGEVAPPDGSCDDSSNTWCDGDEGDEFAQLDNTLWFTFIAPPSGVVEVSTCFQGTDFDTQIALWETEDCSDYESFNLVEANDDYDESLDCASSNPYASIFTACGLNPGQEYYIQVDGWNGATGNLELGVTELDPLTCSARVQVVNNAADAATSTIDFRVNGEIVADDHDDLSFRHASAAANIPVGGNLSLSVNPSTSVDDSEALLIIEDISLEPGQAYQIIIQGISTVFGYDPGPDVAPLDLLIIEDFEETNPNPNNTSVSVVHGSTDAPSVDVDEIFVFDAEVAGDISYNEVQGYVNLPTDNFSLAVTEAGQEEIIEAFYAPLNDLNLGGSAISIFASGFLNPDVNNNGPAFGLWASIPEGGELIPLQIVTSTNEEDVISGLVLYPNPANKQIQIQYDLQVSASVRMDIYDISGRLISGHTFGQRSLGISRETYDVSDLTTGMYFINITIGEKQFTKKLQIQSR